MQPLSSLARDSGAPAAEQPGERASRTVATLVIAVVASGAAAVLMQGDLADHVPAVLIAAVLMVAALFGLSYGLLAATAAAAVYAMFGLPLPSIDMRSGDARLLMLFGAGALLTGFYTDRVRRRERHSPSLLGADRILPGVQGQAPAALVKRPAKVWPDSIMKEARSAFASLCILGAGDEFHLGLFGAQARANDRSGCELDERSGDFIGEATVLAGSTDAPAGCAHVTPVGGQATFTPAAVGADRFRVRDRGQERGVVLVAQLHFGDLRDLRQVLEEHAPDRRLIGAR